MGDPEETQPQPALPSDKVSAFLWHTKEADVSVCGYCSCPLAVGCLALTMYPLGPGSLFPHVFSGLL